MVLFFILEVYSPAKNFKQDKRYWARLVKHALLGHLEGNVIFITKACLEKSQTTSSNLVCIQRLGLHQMAGTKKSRKMITAKLA